MRRVVILADDSAHWKIAGLRQLERLALEINELGVVQGESIQVFIQWSPDVGAIEQFVPDHPRLSHVDFREIPSGTADLCLSTRLFLPRKSATSENFAQCVRADESFEHLENPAQIAACEKRFLRGGGKSQDGLVSRLINRPISRAVTRVLLRTPLTPSAWTLAIFGFPLAGSAFLVRGDYRSVIAGLCLFQLYSILDGCDGEIARAKYLESPRGGQLDTWCDILGNVLLVLGLGNGLSRVAPAKSYFFIESIIVAILIIANELLLLHLTKSTQPPARKDSALYPRHQQMFEASGFPFLTKNFVPWIIQLTKRDVAILAFLILALLHQAPWILHLSGIVAALSALLALKSHFR